MWLFITEILGRTWHAFLGAIGTTSLGFFTNNIEQFFALELVTWLGVWLFRGKEAMLSHKKQNFLFGAVLYLAAIVIVYLPIYVRQVWKVNGEIRKEADAQMPPSITRHLVPPPYAYELSSASIAISLVPQNGLLVDLGGPYKFDDKKEYVLTLRDSAHSLKLVDLEIKFPYPVEAQKIGKTSQVGQVTFGPTLPLINLVGATLGGGGCLGRWSYRLRAISLGRMAGVEILLILNGKFAASPPGVGVPQGNGYVSGSFVYSYRGKTVRSEYYSILEGSRDMIIKASEPQSQIPTGWRRSSGFTVLEGPCIPDNSLIVAQ